MRKRFIWFVLAAVGVLVGCVNLTQPPKLAEDHPANASAPTHESEPATPFLMAATNLSALKLEDLPKAEAASHEHGDHKEHGTNTSAPKQVPAQGAVYTCPHHPEVEQNKPGECPKCGMKLEVKK
jgi:hypothetical protein